MVVNSRACTAVDNEGEPCMGRPVIKERKAKLNNQPSYFVACSGWTPKWRDGHRSFSIPDKIDSAALLKLSNGIELSRDAYIPTCTRIIRSRNGALKRFCGYPHNNDGTLSKLVKHRCHAYRIIFVPIDTSIRQAVIVYSAKKQVSDSENSTRRVRSERPSPHNHPVLVQSKLTYSVTELFKKCIRATTVIGTTTGYLQKATTTSLLLDGKTPGEVHPALTDVRQQRRLLNLEKAKRFPAKTGFEGVWREYQTALQKPQSEQYIHRIMNSDSGGRVILTFAPGLLKLIHAAKQIQGDGTFKRVEGEFNEYELTIWHEATERTLTIFRAYFDRSDMLTYKCIFDGLQDLVLQITGQPLLFYGLHPSGNVHAFGSDMELAELQAAGESFKRFHDPNHTGLTDPTAEDIMRRISRICHVHCKRGVDNLKNKVTPEQYQRMSMFVHLSSEAAIDEFTQWIRSLGNRHIQAWWDHKLQPFILSGIVQCRSKMSLESWTITDSTTNMNEAQHAWTNKFTGTKLSLLEAILTAQKLDFDTLKDVHVSLQSGILRNSRSTYFERTSHNLNRRANKANKEKMKRTQNNIVSDLQQEVNEAEANMKKLKGKLREAKGSKPRARKHAAESSSSGRVAPVREFCEHARTTADPYSIPSTISVRHSLDPPNAIPGPAPALGIQVPIASSSSSLANPLTQSLENLYAAPLTNSSMMFSQTYDQSLPFREYLLSISTIDYSNSFGSVNWDWLNFDLGI
ncbi:hypothetical protein F5878DRAFT_636252 [Lentinula raphanica]|uniref:MULE transposase domain-containing protein n=1 Tax=Lentinula raphanica TaxID=153919 RepID=A0AA38NVP3_9AGAR|nr:hypothetical protein F5878DRAFT_636252 [Lentinula raphanica]